MRTFAGAGCRPGRAVGRVVWVQMHRDWNRRIVPDRPAEILRFRTALNQALDDLEGWIERQEMLHTRLLLRAYQESLVLQAWSERVCSLIDTEGVCASGAAVEAAVLIGAVMSRSKLLGEQGQQLITAARWLAGRLSPPEMPLDAVIAVQELDMLQFLDLRYPALIRAPVASVISEGLPAVWGLPELGPEWNGAPVLIDGIEVVLDPPYMHGQVWQQNSLGGNSTCHLNGDPEAALEPFRVQGERPVVIVSRLDDLAAIRAYAKEVSAVAVNLDQLGSEPLYLQHPGLEALLRYAAEAAREAGVPLLVGGEAVAGNLEHWFALGFTGFFHIATPPERRAPDALRGDTKSSL